MKKISVIIPIYNVEKYLCQCLDSIRNQTFKDLEIICIDDGSTDSCTQILDDFAKNDSRFVVVHKKNEGYGKAINQGIEIAEGEFIGIVDGDDYILPHMYETLYSQIISIKELDFVKSDYLIFYGDDSFRIHSSFCSNYYDRIITAKERVQMFNFPATIWTGLYRRSFLKEKRIECSETPGASFQDEGFNFRSLIRYNKIKWLNNAFYMYRQDNPSSSIKDKSKIFTATHEYELIKESLTSTEYENNKYIYIYKRIQKLLPSFRRADDSIKKDYLRFCCSEYDSIKNIICDQGFDDYASIIECLESIHSDPDKYLEKFLAEKNKVMENNEIYVYGAGQRAFRVLSAMSENGVIKNVINIIVSHLTEKKEMFGVEIKQFDKVNIFEKNALFVIAVKKGTSAYEQIEQSLNEKGISNYISSESLI